MVPLTSAFATAAWSQRGKSATPSKSPASQPPRPPGDEALDDLLELFDDRVESQDHLPKSPVDREEAPGETAESLLQDPSEDSLSERFVNSFLLIGMTASGVWECVFSSICSFPSNACFSSSISLLFESSLLRPAFGSLVLHESLLQESIPR